MELDDTDVYTMHKMGQIALELKRLDIAQMAFEKVGSVFSYYVFFIHNFKLKSKFDANL